MTLSLEKPEAWSYDGNQNLRRAGVQIPFSMEQIEEYIKCRNDPMYFIENYIQIIHVDRGLVNFSPYQYQRNLAQTIIDNRFVITKFPRQSGKSTIVSSLIVWYLVFQDNQNILIAANKSSSAAEIILKVKTAYENLPYFLQQGVIAWNSFSIKLENKSRVTASATSPDTGRSGSFNLVMLDEFAFVKPNVAEAFYTSSYPTLTSGATTKIVIVSTPNGMNLFYKMWQQANQKVSAFVPVEINWFDVPGRDQTFKEETIGNIGEDNWMQEFECTFQGSSATLVSPMALTAQTFRPPAEIIADGVKVFEAPDPDGTYMICVDTCRGKGLDYSAFVVIDISQVPYKIVATYKNDNVSTLYYPHIIYNTATKYNGAYALIEVNDLGQQVADILHGELEYENILGTVGRGRRGQELSPSSTALGVTTTTKVKSVGCSSLKTLIENNQMVINDFEIIEELSNFVIQGTSYKAQKGNHDDLVMSLVLFGWATSQAFFLDLTDQNIRELIFNQRIRQAEEDLIPFGYIEDGIGDSLIDDDGFKL